MVLDKGKQENVLLYFHKLNIVTLLVLLIFPTPMEITTEQSGVQEIYYLSF